MENFPSGSVTVPVEKSFLRMRFAPTMGLPSSALTTVPWNFAFCWAETEEDEPKTSKRNNGRNPGFFSGNGLRQDAAGKSSVFRKNENKGYRDLNAQ